MVAGIKNTHFSFESEESNPHRKGQKNNNSQRSIYFLLFSKKRNARCRAMIEITLDNPT